MVNQEQICMSNMNRYCFIFLELQINKTLYLNYINFKKL